MVSSSSPASVGNLAVFALIIFCWGINWPIMKMTIGDIGILNFRTWCVAAGVFWLFSYARLAGLPLRPPPGAWPRIVALALLNITLWSVLSMLGLAALSSGRAALLNYTMPLWTVLLAWLFLREPLNLRTLTALGLGMLGVALLLIDEIAAIQRSPLGALCMLGAGFVWAVVLILTKGVPQTFPTVSLIAWQMLIGGVPIAISAIWLSPEKWLPTTDGAWFGVLFNTTIVFGYIFVAWNTLVRKLPAMMTGLASLGVPVFGIIGGMVMLGEQPRLWDWLAMSLLLSGVALTLWRK